MTGLKVVKADAGDRVSVSNDRRVPTPELPVRAGESNVTGSWHSHFSSRSALASSTDIGFGRRARRVEGGFNEESIEDVRRPACTERVRLPGNCNA